MNEKLTEGLFKKYPKLFPRDKEGKFAQGSLMAFGLSCGDGWYWLIDNLCDCIQTYIDQNKHLEIPQVQVGQVKEKFGGLRFYIDGGDKTVGGMIWFAENLSYSICEHCGTTENVTCTTEGWRVTLCPKCTKERDERKRKEREKWKHARFVKNQ